MQAFIALSSALADSNRVRALLALTSGELCLCQIIDLLQLAPSTVSKHMLILFQAGLVTRRKEGKWHYFKLAGADASPAVRGALRWTRQCLKQESQHRQDHQKLSCIRKKDLTQVCACYREN
jgi:ArsR family transcriptional regulator